MQGPLGKQRALLTLRAQALRWIDAYKADVVARGLGFTADDVTALETAKAAHPAPTQDDVSLGLRLRMIVVGLAAVFRRYPPAGWTERIEDDVVIATMYGQLFSQVGDLPLFTTSR